VAGDGRKVAGLLVETRLEAERVRGAVLGIGINLNWPRSDDQLPGELRGRTASLAMLSGGRVDRVALLARLLDALDSELATLQTGSSPLDRYREASWLDGRRVFVAVPEGEAAGRVVGIGADGALLLDTDRGERSIAIGEVERVVEQEEVR
jgi:BirA family transcriptional regulator, biotin operon repressor / biotin---[acetyl-CoA-carboxylase] ligase